jgi:hypothetical protein
LNLSSFTPNEEIDAAVLIVKDGKKFVVKVKGLRIDMAWY